MKLHPRTSITGVRLSILLIACAATAAFSQSTPATQPATQTTQPAAQVPAQALPDAPEATAIIPNGPTVVMDTSMGRITCQFFQKQAPIAVANFIGLAEGTKDWTDPATNKVMHHKRYYDGTTFHRVIPEFMIQGGDPTGTGTGGPGYSFDNELNPNLNFDVPGRLAMANTGQPNSNGGQFFVTEMAYDSLNQNYTLFGQCDDASVAVVKTITHVDRDGNDKPLTPVVLQKVTIVREGEPLPPKPGEAPALGSQPKEVAISAGVAVGLLDYRVQPIYPIEAKKAGVSGTVVLRATIGADGLVKDLQIVSGPDLLTQAALDAVRSWRYRPYLLNGQPLEVRTQINVVFTLARP